METTKKKLKDLVKTEENVRIHPENQIDELMKSVNAFGQIRPIVTDEDNRILIGNGLYEAMLKANRKTADVLQKKGLSKVQKKKLILADNRLFELGRTNRIAIENILEEITQEEDFDVPGFDEEILKELYGEAEEYLDKMDDYGNLPDDEDISDGTEPKEQREMLLTNPDIEVSKEDGQKKAFVKCEECGNIIWL